MPSTLDRILASTRERLPALQARRLELERLAAETPGPPPFLGAWNRSRIALVGEVKRRSPSQGTISATMDPVSHAAAYAEAGASAISVLTDGPFFGGSLADLAAVVARVPLPVLRKDFILDPLQIVEARGVGASAVLLIVRALAPDRFRELARVTREWGLAALIEVHDRRELDFALDNGAAVIGINSRNLDTFEIDVASAWSLFPFIPPDRLAIAESGMVSEADVRRAAVAGADGVLIGTALSSAPDPSGLARGMAAVPRTGR